MALSRKRKASVASIGLTAAFLLALAVAPRLFQRTHYTFSELTAPSDETAATMPTSRSFPLIWDQGKGMSRQADLAHWLGDKAPHGVIVNFWATWCAPCLEELPSLENLHRQLSRSPEAGVLLVTISVDEKAEAVSSLFETLDFTPTFPVLHDPDGEFARTLGTEKFPETYWVVGSGQVRHKWIGPQDWLSDSVLDLVARLTRP